MSNKKKIMILGFLSVIVLSGLFAFTSYFDYFAPDDNIGIAILKSDQQGEYWEIVTTGKSTLWYQWQHWPYIGLFFLAIVALISLFLGFIKKISDQEIIEKKQELVDQIEEFKRSQVEFEQKKTKEIEEELVQRRLSIDKIREEALNTNKQGELALREAERINKRTNHSHKSQDRENRSKLSQRDRLREQKRVIAKFLQISGWKLPDGTPFTYNSLLNYSQKYDL